MPSGIPTLMLPLADVFSEKLWEYNFERMTRGLSPNNLSERDPSLLSRQAMPASRRGG